MPDGGSFKNKQQDVQVLRIGDIVRDERWQFRPLDNGMVKRYATAMTNGNVFPAVKVANFNGALILVDGWHRVAAHERAGIDRVEAEVVPANTEKEIEWLAAIANITNGLALKSNEYRKVFKAYVGARQHRKADKSFKSYREIAAEVGGAKSHTTIRNWMKTDFPGVFRAMSSNEDDDVPLGVKEPDTTTPSEVLAVSTLEALAKARAALPGVTDYYNRCQVLDMLKSIHEDINRMDWESLPEGWGEPQF